MSDMIPSDVESDDEVRPPPPQPHWMVRGSAPSSPPPPPKRLRVPMRQGTLQLTGMTIPQPTPAPKDGWLFVDLFCSIGGVSIAAKTLGHNVVLAMDMDESRIGVHRVNHPHCKHVTMELGPAVTEQVVALIEEAVPQDQRHRLWLHQSPPCQTQSSARFFGKLAGGKLATHENYHEIKEDKEDGLALVRWSLDLVARLQPAQWSLEEVDDKPGQVAGLLQEYKRKDKALFDYGNMEMAEFGVPQMRKRMIGGRPATMRALRLSQTLRVPKPVVIQDVVTPPEGAVYLRGIKNRHITDKSKVRRCKTLEGRWTDGRVELWEFWLLAPSPCGSHPHAWMNADYDKIRVLNPAETGALMTFPSDFVWPDGRCDSLCNADLGNAVPPLFAQKMIRAASTHV